MLSGAGGNCGPRIYRRSRDSGLGCATADLNPLHLFLRNEPYVPYSTATLPRLTPFARNSTLVIVPCMVVARATRGMVEPTVNTELGAGLTILTVIPWVSRRCVPPLNNVRRPRMVDNTVLTGNFRFGPSEGVRKKLKLIWMRLSLPKLIMLFWFIVRYTQRSSAALLITQFKFRLSIPLYQHWT